MGAFINKGNEAFRRARSSEYIDKSGMISIINDTLDTERCCTCVTRCRRFGKSMAAGMLNAYYDESCNSFDLFRDLEIAQKDSFLEHLNKHPVIYLDITDFTTKYPHDHTIASHINCDVKAELLNTYPEVIPAANDDLMDVLRKVVSIIGKKFIIIIDEWDAICREFEPKTQEMDAYVNLLRRLFKGSDTMSVFAGVYMTGILPIKKYKTDSALNNFEEYSMVDPAGLAGYFGFRPSEVVHLAQKYGVDQEELKKWYDGYKIGDESSIYNPYSVIKAVTRHKITSYWSNTGAYDAVVKYIMMNFDGLKDDIIKMLAGGSCRVNTTRFQNDMSIVRSEDDVLTVLIHLGYLAYDWEKCVCYIPNREVGIEFKNAVEDTGWTRLVKSLQDSQDLLDATLRGDGGAVARGIDAAHDENTSILSYNDENSLACVLSIAYYFARNDYIIHREFATGKGFADLVLIPRRNVKSPALIIELKYDKAVDTAIDQIKERNYPAKVGEYTGEFLLVGVTYDRRNKMHSCTIEKCVR